MSGSQGGRNMAKKLMRPSTGSFHVGRNPQPERLRLRSSRFFLITTKKNQRCSSNGDAHIQLNESWEAGPGDQDQLHAMFFLCSYLRLFSLSPLCSPFITSQACNFMQVGPLDLGCGTPSRQGAAGHRPAAVLQAGAGPWEWGH